MTWRDALDRIFINGLCVARASYVDGGKVTVESDLREQILMDYPKRLDWLMPSMLIGKFSEGGRLEVTVGDMLAVDWKVVE